MKTEKKVSDSVLIRQFVDGDQKAFEMLLARHHQRIYASILLMVRDTDIANDIMQDTLIKVMCSLQEGRYEDKGKFAMWAMRIAHNHAMNYFRGKRLTMEANIDDSEALLPLGEDFSDLNVEEQAIIIEQRKDVHKMLNFLPSNQRQIVLMRYYSNMSFKEIADLLKININTALGRMHYAIINLRKMMEKHRNSLQTLVV